MSNITVKIISNITPYNDIYYKNCFYHAFFPVLNHFNAEIYPFLTNDVFIYRYDEKKTGIKLDLEIISQRSFNEMLKYLNINEKTKIKSTDIISDITLAISNERPVIIMIDCFYEPIRPHAYQKEHMSHCVLVYGYDDIEKNFYILEQNFRDSHLYEKRTISYTDIINSYNGFIENYLKDNTWPTYHEYGFEGEVINNTNDLRNSDYIQELFGYMSGKKSEIYEGLECIKLFAGDYREIVLNESLLVLNIEELIEKLNHINNSKKVEKYHISRILGAEHDFLDAIESVINNISIIRGVICKFQLTRKITPKSIEHTVNLFNNIYEMEKQWYNGLFTYLEERKG